MLKICYNKNTKGGQVATCPLKTLNESKVLVLSVMLWRKDMDRVDEILLYIQKTNPEMTREKLVEELRKSEYAAKSLIFGAMNVKK